jgi:hypothetical protein
MDYYKITKSSSKADLYRSRDFFWVDELKKWICFDPVLNKFILNDSRFCVVKYDISNIENRFNYDLTSLKKTINNLPVAKDGDEHKILRKAFAIQIKSKYDECLNCFNSNLQNLILTILKKEDEIINLQQHMEMIIWKSVLSLSGLGNYPIELATGLSQIFDETLSLSCRIRLNDLINELAIDIQKYINSDDDVYFKIALMSLGNDSLLATLQESILLILLRNDGRYLDEMDWDIPIPASGVPVVERFASEEVLIDQQLILKGQRIRLYLDSSGYTQLEGPRYSSLYFGSGSHLCLGMPLGIKIWEDLRDQLKKIHLKVNVKKFAYRENDNVFNLLSTFQVKFSE